MNNIEELLAERERKVLNYLLSCDDWKTSYDISINCDITRRQVRTVTASLRDILQKQGYILSSCTSLGYRIEDKHELIRSMDRTRAVTSYPSLEKYERYNTILEILINADDYVLLDDLAEMLYVSRATISSLLNQPSGKAVLERRNIRIKNKVRKGIRLEGNERDIRALQTDLIFGALTMRQNMNEFIRSLGGGTAEMAVMYILEEFRIHLSDISLLDFCVCLITQCFRVCRGHTLQAIACLPEVPGRTEYAAAKRIAVLLEKEFSFTLNDYEVNYIAVNLIAKRSIKGIEPVTDRYIIEITDVVLKRIYNQTGIVFPNEFYQSVSLHISKTVFGITCGEKIRYPYFQDIREQCPQAYELAVLTNETIEQYTGISPSSSYTVFFTMLYNSALKSVRETARKAMLICEYDIAFTNSISQTIECAFPYQIKIVKTTTYAMLYKKENAEYDLVLSTTPVDIELNAPIIYISSFPSEKDFQRIRNYLYTESSSFRPEYYLNPSLFTSRPKEKTLQTCFETVLEKHSASAIQKSLYSSKNNEEILHNDINLVRLERPLCSAPLTAVQIADENSYCSDEYTNMTVVFSLQDEDQKIYALFRSLLEKITVEEAEFLKEKRPDYPDFICFLKTLQNR